MVMVDAKGGKMPTKNTITTREDGDSVMHVVNVNKVRACGSSGRKAAGVGSDAGKTGSVVCGVQRSAVRLLWSPGRSAWMNAI